MPVTIIQAGNTLQRVDSLGGLTTLTLPTGITLRQDIPPRWATYGRFIILTNTPSQPLTIDATATVRVLTPKPPRFAPTLSGVAGGALTGAYRVQETFVLFDDEGNLISESDFSPFSSQVTISGQDLQAANLDISPIPVDGRRLYRTTNGGAVYFQWVDVDGNIITSVKDDVSDAGLSLVAAPILGTPPDLTLIAEFRDRLWGVDRIAVDDLRYTEVGFIYAWPADNDFPIPSVGSDLVGIKALMPRREALGVGRQNQLLQIIGSDDTNFQVIKLSQNCGVASHESVAVYRDTAYFLWEDGVYSWSDEGIQCLSDGKVRSWFAGNSDFNRDRFQFAFGAVDPVRNKYRLYLTVAGSTSEVNWVEYDIRDKTWWGPHLTTAYTPTSSFILFNDDLVPQLTIGGDTNLFKEQDLKTDGTPATLAATGDPIEFDVITKRYAMGVPDIDKFWGELSVIGKAQIDGEMTIDMSVGEINATLNSIDTWDMTIPRQRLARAGTGKHLQLELINDEVAQDVEVYDIEINPVVTMGRR